LHSLPNLHHCQLPSGLQQFLTWLLRLVFPPTVTTIEPWLFFHSCIHSFFLSFLLNVVVVVVDEWEWCVFLDSHQSVAVEFDLVSVQCYYYYYSS
jgi:hypothetical protein